MQKNMFFYLVAFALLLACFFFFRAAYQEISADTQKTNKTNAVLINLQQLSRQLNNAVVMNTVLDKKTATSEASRLFATDSPSVIRVLNFLKAQVTDPPALTMVNDIDNRIRSEIPWIFKSDVAGSIAKHRSREHISSILYIDSIIKQATGRTSSLLAENKNELNAATTRLTIWMLIFIVLCGFLLVYTSTGLLRQQSKRIKKEKELEISNRLLTNAQHIAKTGNWKLSLDRKQLEWSDELYRLLEETKETYPVNYAAFLQSVHDEDREVFERELASSMKGDTELDLEHRIVLRSGKVKWLHERGQLALDGPGKPFFFSGSAQDITKRKTLELSQKEAIEKQLLFASIVNSSEDAITSKTLSGTTVSWNRGAENIFGYSEKEVVGSHGGIIIPADLLDEEAAILEKIKYGEHVKHFETVRVKKDGSHIHVSLTASPIVDSTGKITGVSEIAQDITERKEAEQKIYEANQRFEYVTRATFDAIWDWDVIAKTVFWGEGYFHLFGKMEDSGLTDLQKVQKRIHVDDIPLLKERSYKSLKSNDMTWSHEHRFLKADGDYALVSNKAVIIRDAGGKAVRVIGAMQDITKQKEEERALRLMESVVTNTTDGVMVTEAFPLEKPGPRIVYINDAFTKMTGYSPADIIGLTPRTLQGPKSDEVILDQIRMALKSGQPCDFTIINYKKNGEEFWMNSSISPVHDNKECCSHWIAIQRDVTQQKNEELQKKLLAEIMQAFTLSIPLNQTLYKVVGSLVNSGNCCMAEAWLTRTDKKRINLAAAFSTDGTWEKLNARGGVSSYETGEGLPGRVWQNSTSEYWDNAQDNAYFKRAAAAKTVGINSVIGLPVVFNDEVIAVFIMGFYNNQPPGGDTRLLFENLSRVSAAEIKRKQLEQELNRIFSFAPDIICSIGTDGYYKKTNPAACKLLEYTEEELLAQPVADFMYPEDRLRTSQIIARMGRGNTPFYIENRFITKSGRIKWLASNCAPSPGEELIFSVAKDITEKKALEDLLERTSTLARMGSWEADLVKGTVYWANIVKEIHEVSPSYVPDLQTAINFYKAGENRELITRKVQEAIEKGTPWDVESLLITNKGRELWVRSIGEPEFVNGKCVKAYGSFQDIDVRKRAELAVSLALAEKDTILDSIGDGFFAVNKNWAVTYLNNQAEKELRVSRENILQKNIWDIFDTSIGTGTYQKFHQTVESNEAIHFEDYNPSLLKWYEISAYPSENGLSVYFRDVTERKISEIKLKELNEDLQLRAKELAVSNAELEQFAYIASHDLQEPLRNISSFLILLEKQYAEVLEGNGKKYIDFAVDGAQRMRQIILDLLEFSRVGRTDDQKEDIDLNSLVNDVKALLGKNIEETGASIDVDRLPVIHSFRAPMRQVFQNLVGNALKYSRRDTAANIQIGVEEQGNYWLFSVKDNGIGIRKDHHDRIFVIFQRLHNRNAYPGTGMGLAITKKIIENLGGRIWVDSAEGEGSCFYFTIRKDLPVEVLNENILKKVN